MRDVKIIKTRFGEVEGLPGIALTMRDVKYGDLFVVWRSCFVLP